MGRISFHIQGHRNAADSSRLGRWPMALKRRFDCPMSQAVAGGRLATSTSVYFRFLRSRPEHGS